MEDLIVTNAHIPGWGVDIDPDNEPTYPMKKYTGDDHRRIHYARPKQQPASVEVLHSNERPGLTAVFGTSSPPTGLSGNIRRYAFRFSEGSWNHWLPLILADRINVVEGLVDDLRRGHIPNLVREQGLMAAWKYNRPVVVRNLTIAAAVGLAWYGYRKTRRLFS